MKQNEFYLACLRDTLGTNMVFHCKDGRGYSSDISRAHVYTREEAQHAWDTGREFDLPVSKKHIDQFAEWHVDTQLVSRASATSSKSKFGYLEGTYNGNDLYWYTGSGFSFDINNAYPLDDHAPTDLIPVIASEAHKASRPTFNIQLLNRRKMVQAAGLVTPERIKKIRRRVTNPKERWNCPACGKISWQYDPYDFEGCNDVSCDEWEPKYR